MQKGEGRVEREVAEKQKRLEQIQRFQGLQQSQRKKCRWNVSS
jgi:hypothetical protein